MLHTIFDDLKTKYKCFVVISDDSNLTEATRWCLMQAGCIKPSEAMNPTLADQGKWCLFRIIPGKVHFFFQDDTVAVEFKLRFG